MDRHGGDRIADDFVDVVEADAIEGRVCVDGIELVVKYGECRLYITVYRLPTHISVEEESTLWNSAELVQRLGRLDLSREEVLCQDGRNI